MTDFLSKYRESRLPNPQSDFAESILNELSNQIYEEWKSKNISCYVGTSYGHGEGFVMITLNLMSGNDDDQYFYRLIEIEQPIDKPYPVRIRAFQNPPTDWKDIQSPDTLRQELIEIMGMSRVRVIAEMVKQMGETIKAWKSEKDESSQ